jgi:hypothetical protein
LVHLNDAFRRGRPVSKGTVWPNGVVVFSPVFDDYPRFLDRVKQLSVKQLVPEAGIEALALSITLAGVAFAGSTAGKPLTLQKGNSINNYQGFGSANKAHLDEPEKQK